MNSHTIKKSALTYSKPPGCTVAFSTGKSSEANETLIVKNGDIDSHWYMQMYLSKKATYRNDPFYDGPLEQYRNKQTHSFIGQRCMSYWAPHMGINDAQVSISLLATPGREDSSKKGQLGGFDYNRIVLEQAGNGSSAVDILGKAVEQFGFSDFSMSYVIGDPKEVWIFEASGFQWAAKCVQDDVGAHANNYIIQDDWDRCSDNLYGYAIAKGWLKNGEHLNFREVYSGAGYLDEQPAPLPDIFSSYVRYNRALELVTEYRDSGPVSKKQLMALSRDQLNEYRLENGQNIVFNQTPWHSTEFYRDDFNGGEWLDSYPDNHRMDAPVFIRQICCDTVYEKTLGAAVFVSGKLMEGTGLMYSLTGVPTFSAFSPYFAGMSSVHPSFNGIAAAKLFESIDLQAFGKYQQFHPICRSILDPVEENIIAGTDIFLKQRKGPVSHNELMDFSYRACEEIITAGIRVIDSFHLNDLRIRSWGRTRKGSERVPDIYTIINEAVITTHGAIQNQQHPLAIEKDDSLLIDINTVQQYLAPDTRWDSSESPLYVNIEDAAVKMNFDWEDVPGTGDLYIFKK